MSPARTATDEPVIDTATIRGGIKYWEAYLRDNDARYVFSFVRSALDSGALAANYVELVAAERSGGRWHVTLKNVEGGAQLTCTAKVIVNAAGPFIGAIDTTVGVRTKHRVVYSGGIHLIVPRLTQNHRVLAFFDDNTQRLFYVIPMGRRSVLGATDTRTDDPYSSVTDEDRDFLFDANQSQLTS